MKIVFTPDWFLSPDVLIELFSFLILFTFFMLSIRGYRINKNKSSLFLGFSFFLIAIAEISTLLTKLILYYNVVFTKNIAGMVITYSVLKSVNFLYYLGFFLHKFFTLFGFYVLYRISLNRQSKGDILLGIYFIIISSLFGQLINWVFHITSLVLLILIIRNYYIIYKKNKSPNTYVLIFAFILLAISQGIFIFSELTAGYVAAQIIQLVSYVVLLSVIIRILSSSKNGKEKK